MRIKSNLVNFIIVPWSYCVNRYCIFTDFYVLDDKFFTRKYDSYKYENHNSWVIALQDCFMKQFLCDHPSLNRYREEQVIFKHRTKQKILCSNLGFRSTNNINSPRQIVHTYKFHTFGVKLFTECSSQLLSLTSEIL